MQNFDNTREAEKSKRLILLKPSSTEAKLKDDVKEVLNKYSKLLSRHHCALRAEEDTTRISADINQYWFDAEIKVNKNKVLIDYKTNAPKIIEKIAVTSVKQFFAVQ